jgi:matrixin
MLKTEMISDGIVHKICFIEIMKPSDPPTSSVSKNPPLFLSGLARAIYGISAVVATFCGPIASAYVLESGSPRWSAGTVTFQLALGSANRTLIDGNTSWATAAVPAFTIWNQSLGSIQLVAVTNPSAPVSEHDGVNSVAFASTFFGDSFGSNTLAITGYYYSGGRMTEADVLFNNRIQWDSYRGSLRFGSGGAAIGEIRRVLIHELGHALGLDHPDQHGQHVAAVMNSIVSNIDSTAQDDINGIQSIYGAGTGGTPTPTPTPTATPSATPTPTPSATPSLRTVTISTSTQLVRPGQTATFTVSVSSVNPSVPLTVNYITGGTAKMNRNYVLSGTPRQVIIPAGASSANVMLTVTKAARRAKNVTIFLVSGTGYSLSPTRSASTTITR